MKTIVRLAALLAFVIATPLVQTGCQTAPDTRVIPAYTLLAIGQSAETAVALSAQLYKDGRLTAAQAREVVDFFNSKFQPVYRYAVAAAQSDLSSLASPDLINLASQLAQLVQTFSHP